MPQPNLSAEMPVSEKKGGQLSTVSFFYAGDQEANFEAGEIDDNF